MLYIASMICFINIVIIFIRKNKFSEPIFIFSLVWFGMLSMYMLNSKRYIEIEKITELCFLLTVISFSCGCYLSEHIRLKGHKSFRKYNYIMSLDSKLPEFNMNFLKLMQIIAILILSYAVIIDIKTILSGYSMSYFRYNILPEIRTPIYLSLIMYVANPIVWISIPIGIIRIVYRKSSIQENILFVILYIASILSSGGGRIPFLYIAVCIYTTLFIKDIRINLSKKKKKTLTFMMAMFIVFIAYVSWSRGSVWYNELLSYISIPIPAFDYQRRLAESGNICCYGFLSFQGFIRPLELLMRSLGSTIIQNVDQAYFNIDQRVVLTHLGGSSNSSVSCTAYFYYDGGICGVVLLSFLFGYISKYLYKRMYFKFNIINIAAYMMIAFYIAFSFVNISSAHIEWGFAFIWLYLISKFKLVNKKSR